MKKRFEQWFIFSTAVVLFISAAFILLSTTTKTRLLETPDSLFAVATSKIFFVIAGYELAVSALLLLMRNHRLKLLIIATTACNLMIYQIGVLQYGGPNLFVCLGDLTPWMPITPALLNGISHWVLGLLFTGSCLFLAGDLVRRPQRTPVPDPIPSAQNC